LVVEEQEAHQKVLMVQLVKVLYLVALLAQVVEEAVVLMEPQEPLLLGHQVVQEVAVRGLVQAPQQEVLLHQDKDLQEDQEGKQLLQFTQVEVVVVREV
jgi:hypothetical protein